MLGLLWERWETWIISLTVSVLWYILKINFPQDPSGLLGASATLAAVFAGFLGVAQGLILTMKDSEAYKILKENDLLSRLFSYLRSGISSSVFLAVLSVVGFFLVTPNTGIKSQYKIIFESIWAFSSMFSFVSYHRITKIMFKLLGHV